ncbi:MAG: hypothetical protein ACPGYV_01185, partial [Phycisphaeraceae bacterium]
RRRGGRARSRGRRHAHAGLGAEQGLSKPGVATRLRYEFYFETLSLEHFVFFLASIAIAK